MFDQASIYAVIDAAKVFGLPERLQMSGLQHRCLYYGRGEEEWGDAAPWLVQLDPNHQLTRKFFLAGKDAASLSFQRSTSLFFTGSDDFDSAASHLRKFTKMRAEDGRVLTADPKNPLYLQERCATSKDQQANSLSPAAGWLSCALYEA